MLVMKFMLSQIFFLTLFCISVLGELYTKTPQDSLVGHALVSLATAKLSESNCRYRKCKSTIKGKKVYL